MIYVLDKHKEKKTTYVPERTLFAAINTWKIVRLGNQRSDTTHYNKFSIKWRKYIHKSINVQHKNKYKINPLGILKAFVFLFVSGLCYSLVRRRNHFKYGVTEIL